MNKQSKFVQERLAAFRAGREKIKTNPDYSIIGRDKALAQWKTTTAGQYGNFY